MLCKHTQRSSYPALPSLERVQITQLLVYSLYNLMLKYNDDGSNSARLNAIKSKSPELQSSSWSQKQRLYYSIDMQILRLVTRTLLWKQCKVIPQLAG